MSFFDPFARRLRFLAIPHITTFIIIGQALTYSMELVTAGSTQQMPLVPARVFEGEWWRPFTFIFDPPRVHPIWVVFLFFFIYLMGSALEQFWGAFKYNLFLFVGWMATCAAAFTFPEHTARNLWLWGSVFLAFSWLAPDFRLQLFLLPPLRIKYVAIATVFWFAWVLWREDWPMRILVLASICNFLLFFAAPIARRLQSGHFKMQQEVTALATRGKPRHSCAVCGATELSHSEMDFRYCTRCAAPTAYCSEHIGSHDHLEPKA